MDTENPGEAMYPSVMVSKNASIKATKSGDDWTQQQARAQAALSPSMNAAFAVESFGKPKFGEIDIAAIVESLRLQISEIKNGDMSGPEAMLISQASALQSLWVNLMNRANRNAEYIESFESLLGFALKAQSQCRTTLLALNEIKFPKSATFVKQANIANQQQVNNGPLAHAEKNIEPSNEQLTEGNHATLDLGGTGAAGATNPDLETVGEIDGAKNAKRKAAKREKRP